jgi:N-acyl-D-amino-acid deacylase
MASYSYLIKGGTIIDGSGFPMTRGDIGLSGETIKFIGSSSASGATRVIDATGKYIMPGIIDITNHSDTHWTLFNYPGQESMLAQGITTIIGGACGSSIAPLTDARAIRAIQKWVDISNININWRSMADFFEELGKHNLGVNFGTLVGHGTLRRDITGDDPRELTKDEYDAMELLLRRSLDEGALGISFGLASSHGRTVSQEEIIGLAKLAAEQDKLISIHMRNEGRRLLSSIVETINIARSSGGRTHISHLKAIGRKAWADTPRAISILRKAIRDEQLSISFDFFPYLRTGSLLYNLLPDWILEGGKEKILSVLTDKNQETVVQETIRTLTLHYENITIAEAQRDKQIIGKTLAAIAQSAGLSPEETMIKILVTNDLSVTIFGKTLASRNLVAIAKESSSIFSTDGVGENPTKGKASSDLSHPRSYGAVPRFLDRLVRQHGILTWEAAIKKMTSTPAERLRISESRGSIKKGFFADIVIFDPSELKDNATYSDPYQYASGIEYVFVNGRLTIEKGAFTGALAGKILRRG